MKGDGDVRGLWGRPWGGPEDRPAFENHALPPSFSVYAVYAISLPDTRGPTAH